MFLLVAFSMIALPMISFGGFVPGSYHAWPLWRSTTRIVARLEGWLDISCLSVLPLVAYDFMVAYEKFRVVLYTAHIMASIEYGCP